MGILLKYLYCEDNDMIYELGEHGLYYPIIFVVAAEQNCNGSIKTRVKLEYMKEYDLSFYVELVEQGKLDEHIRQYIIQLKKLTNELLSEMNIQDEMGRLMAEEIVRETLL